MISDDNVTKLWSDYQSGLTYQATSGLSRDLPQFVKFYEGKQWAPATKNTKNLPRPVINIIKMICRSKKSAILSAPVKIIYESDNAFVDVEKFNRFSEYIQKEMRQDELDRTAVGEGCVKGSYFFHYYWDSEAIGKDGIKEGGLRCELIDPLNIFFANPVECDEQKQKWILIATREDVESVRAKRDKGVSEEDITPDESSDKYGTIEPDGNKLCTVLTRYFRKDGEVYCEKATRKVVVNKAFPISPDIERASRLFEEDAPNNSLPDNHDTEPLTDKRVRATLYPIVAGCHEPREKCIYGIGEAEGIIPNQKAINFTFAMALLNVQKMAWGKYIAHKDALKGQVITDEPGQVLIDYSPSGNGIRKLTEQDIHSAPSQLVDSLMQMTRVATGATEVMTGEVLRNLSGAAIAQLQSQATQPIADLRKAFWEVKKKQGLVLAQFFKLYYAEKEFVTEIRLKGEERAQKQKDVFYGGDYIGTEFDVVVEATAGTQASAAGDINVLDVLLSKNLISLKTYLNAYPSDALTNRSKILKGVEEDEASDVTVLRQQNENYAAQLTQATELIARQKETVDNVVSLIKENNQLKSTIADLYNEAIVKIREGNARIEESTSAYASVRSDAETLARMVAERDGLIPNNTQ